ncbi:MAG: alpha-2-macroglobulin [Ignavibacteriaceae bacterium]
MMKTINGLILLIFITVFLGCGPSNSVKVVEFSPEGEVPSLITFTVDFSENLAPADIQDKWLTDEFIYFTPAIKGKFKWVSPSRLLFSPDSPLEPMQSYSAEITKKVLFNTTFDPDFDDFEFNTADLNLDKVDVFWTNIPKQYYKLSVQGNLTFNYPVSPPQLKKYLEVRQNGKIIDTWKITNDNASNKITINFGEVQQTEKEQEFTIYIKKGLESVYGKKPLDKAIKLVKTLPPITELTVTGVSSGFDGESGWLEVETSQMVDEKKLKDYVSITPSVELRFSVSENLFRIEGNFATMQTVDLLIKKGLSGSYGGKLQEDFEQSVSMIDIAPSVNFADKKGTYLMLGGEKNLQVNTVNVTGVDIQVNQVFKNNIALMLNNYSETYSYEDYGYNPQYYVGDFGRNLYSETVNLKNRRNWLEKFSVNLNKIVTSKNKGIFVVNVSSTEDGWISDSKIIALSDLAIIAKKGKDELVVFVNSIKEAEPVEDVAISLISSNNQTLLSGTTNKEGVIRFLSVTNKIKGFQPVLITAERNDDFNFIDLRKTFIETSRFEVDGINQINGNFSVFTYSDRNIYRPGETVYLSSIIRTNQIKIPNDIPVFLKIINPQGKTIQEIKKTLNEQGSFESAIPIPGYSMTGEYTAEIYNGVDNLIGTYKFAVEDFVPDKLRVHLKNSNDNLQPGDSLSINIDAEFLFGAKGSNLKYESYISLKSLPYKSKTYSDYTFDYHTPDIPQFENVSFDGILDDNGRGKIVYSAPYDLKSQGYISATSYVSVFDLTNRTVNRVSSFNIYPFRQFLGIKNSGEYYGVNQNISFGVIAIDPNDKLLTNKSITATLVRYEWNTVLKKDYSDRYYYASEEKEIIEWTKEYSVSNGKKDLSLIVTKSGRYELRISYKLNDHYVKKTFYAYGFSSATSTSFEVDKEGKVDIIFDKPVYRPGEKAKVLFIGPFSGNMLITMEREGVLYNKYINFENKSAQVEIPVFDDYMPNAYVTATLFKKHGIDNTTPFLVAHGFASMKVERSELKLPLSISHPQKIKPNSRQEITIKTAPSRNIYVTLAAVDEGILQIRNFITPDPYKSMYAKRSLSVESYDLYKLLLPEILTMNSSFGGDDFYDSELKKRTNPITSKRFNLFAFWSGIKKSDGNGIVKIPIDVGEFNGEVRFMAVAYSGSKFGSAESHMKVVNDIIIEPEIPKFLTARDKLTSPVTVINTTSNNLSLSVNITTEGPVKIIGQSIQNITVKSNSTSRVSFNLEALDQIGEAKIVITASGPVKVKEVINIGVRPNSPLVTESGSGTIKAGSDVKIKIPNNFVDGTFSASLKISKFPVVKFAKQLKSLIGYPYGCIEQTVSKAFPLLYLGDIAKVTVPELFTNNAPTFYVKEAIRKIESMQLYDGSISYWQGEGYPSWWGSVYAAHFLIESKNAGYSVNETTLNRLLAYLAKKAREQSTYDYVTYSNGTRTVSKIASKEIIYSLYVLALVKRGDVSTMNYYKSKIYLVSTDMRYLLAASFAQLGQWNSYHSIIPKFFKSESTDRLSGSNFDSEIRANSIMLNVLLDTDPKNQQIPQLIKYLSDKIANVYTTQEQAFFFLAMGKAAARTADSKVNVDLYVDNKLIGSSKENEFQLKDKNLRGKTLLLKGTGKGELYYFWSAEGVKYGEKVKEIDNNMGIRREYYDYKTGSRILNNSFYQGQLLVCKILLIGQNQSAENVVVTDLVPAGFEIENPRLSASGTMTWTAKNPVNVQYLDVRDDRLLLFTKLESNTTKEYNYMLRVVNQGSYNLPVISAEAMYNPDFRSYNGSALVQVTTK